MGWYQQNLQPRLLTRALDTPGARAIRARVCAGLAGDVLEIGYGSGLNQPHLPSGVRSVTAVEPSAVALRLSQVRRQASSVPVVVAGRDAQDLPFADDRFDAALSTWTLCGMDDPVQALREVGRVLKPGGVLHFVEHGVAPDRSVARWQRRASGLNKRIAGCVLDRDVRGVFELSGLDLLAFTSYYDEESPRPAGYFSEGRARA